MSHLLEGGDQQIPPLGGILFTKEVVLELGRLHDCVTLEHTGTCSVGREAWSTRAVTRPQIEDPFKRRQQRPVLRQTIVHKVEAPY